MQLAAESGEAIEWMMRMLRIGRCENSGPCPRGLPADFPSFEQTQAIATAQQLIGEAEANRSTANHSHMGLHRRGELLQWLPGGKVKKREFAEEI
jgi:hypothetical protein